MGKSRRGDKERSREQELKYENNKLRREVSSLRKQLARVDLDRYSQVRDIVQEHLTSEEESIDSARLLEKMKAKWRCNEGSCSGHLEIVIYAKMGHTWYFRQCSECPNRTAAKPHHPGVEGIKKEIPLEPDKIVAKKKSYKDR